MPAALSFTELHLLLDHIVRGANKETLGEKVICPRCYEVKNYLDNTGWCPCDNED